jgi:hypothetical protein
MKHKGVPSLLFSAWHQLILSLLLLFSLHGLGQETARITDSADMADSSGDIAGIGATVIGNFLH